MLDFDGVICDSAFEAFRMALTTVGEISHPFSEASDCLYSEFYEKRISVGPAWNYYYVMQELLNNKWAPWVENKASEQFVEKFFEVRRKAQQKKQKWLSLNPVYDNIVEILSPHTVTILTNKSRDPVEKLLIYNKISYDYIISMPEHKRFKNKTDLMNHYYRDQNVKFIDDHIGIITDVRSRAMFNVDARHASWGYTKDKIPAISLELKDLGNWLTNVR